MKSISKILVVIVLLLSMIKINAQIANKQIVTVKVSGNCKMCKATIEKAGNLENIAKVDWNKETKIATITFDGKKTNSDEILKRIALAGYDNETFLASKESYSKLPSCCQYERTIKSTEKNTGKYK